MFLHVHNTLGGAGREVEGSWARTVSILHHSSSVAMTQIGPKKRAILCGMAHIANSIFVQNVFKGTQFLQQHTIKLI